MPTQAEFDEWNYFRSGENLPAPRHPVCYWCGQECSGDSWMQLVVDGTVGNFPVCDEEDACTCR